MSKITDFLTNIQKICRLHESMLKEVCEEHRLTLIEAKIISFLHNNPGKDTAADIVELRMLQKGNVSQAVETLVQKSLLQRRADETDRRKIHLLLTEQAEPVVKSIDFLWGQFQTEIFGGLSAAEREMLDGITEKIKQNVQNTMERREGKYV